MVEEFAAQATLSIVIPAYRSQTLDVVLESVRELQAEVVVVDSSPSEPPELSVEADVCRLPHRTPPGEARNIGAKRTRTDFILFLDSDVKLTETCRTFIRNQLANPEHDVVCGVYRTDPQVNGPIAALQNSVLKYRLLRNAHNRDAFGSASHMLIRRETFEQVGGFSPALMLYEDDEFSARSTRLGFPVTVDGGFEAVHLKRFSVWSLIKDYWVKAFSGFLARRRYASVFKGLDMNLGSAIGLTWIAGCLLPVGCVAAIAWPGASTYGFLVVVALFMAPALLWTSVLRDSPAQSKLLSLVLWPAIAWSVASATSAAVLVWLWRALTKSMRGLADWICIGYRVISRSGMPVQIVHYVTARCNLRCEHCFYKETLDAPNPGEMSLETMNRTMEEIGPTLWHALAGGEPFLRSDLDEVIALVQKHCRPKVLSFPTNGWYVDRTFEITLRTLQRIERGNLVIAFSLDGPEDLHDEIRGSGSYARVIQTMERLRPLKALYPNLHLNVVTTVMPQNAEVAPDFIEQIVKEFRPNAISINLFRYHSESHPPIPLEVIEGYEKATEVYRSHMEMGNLDFYGFLGRRALSIKEFLQKELITRVAREDEFVTPCTAGTLSYVINEDGTVAACEILDPERNLGAIEGTQRSGKPLMPLADKGIPVVLGPVGGGSASSDASLSTFRELVQSDKAAALRTWIRDTECRCTWECAMSTNTFFSWPFAGNLYRRLAKSLVVKPDLPVLAETGTAKLEN